MSTPTILIVEDEDSFVEALTIGLSREGFRVEVAQDGAQALTRFNEVHPDVVLLDLMLPRISGIASSAACNRSARTCDAANEA